MSTSSNSGTGQLPLRSALKTDDDGDKTPPVSGTLKAVQIAEPVPEYRTLEEDGQPLKQFRASHSRRLSGKFASTPQLGTSSRSSNYDGSPSLRPVDDSHHSSNHYQRQQYYSEKLLAQVGEWLQRQQTKQSGRKKLHHQHRKSPSPPPSGAPGAPSTNIQGDEGGDELQRIPHRRTDSMESQSSEVSLDRLQRIVEESMASMGLKALPQLPPKQGRIRSRRRSILQRTASSDTDYVDGDVRVPDCDVWLDNTKTLSSSETSNKNQREREAWLNFKNEILRIAHTLKLKNWRRVPLGAGESIHVERICGALTNAVYAVTPPHDLPGLEGKKPPPKLLLRIYGPQVEHLIDRENELKVLQRLARKKIGPRLLGTFKNGRFEEFFHAANLKPSELRDPDVSKQIAKRMRELHEGIEVLPQERDVGPSVWKNWDQWQDKAAMIVEFLDKQLETSSRGSRRERQGSVLYAWKQHGYVCGAPWPLFKATVSKYRAYQASFYKDQNHINQSLIFAHNDTQYGNILRFQPDDEKSPLLQPANKHKQLVVIDFEYASPNIPGNEFANHFTEWTYDYHDPVLSYACNTNKYPKPEEQHRFLKAYVDHRPQFPHASSTPRLTPLDSPAAQGPAATGSVTTPKLLPSTSSSSIVDFMLDSRAPPGGWGATERAREEQTEKQVRELMEEARLWRPANSAMWVAWGIVQAKVPGLDQGDDNKEGEGNGEDNEDNDDEEEFDYLSYSQDRALFFWGDMIQLGLVKMEDLPELTRSNLKIVDY